MNALLFVSAISESSVTQCSSSRVRSSVYPLVLPLVLALVVTLLLFVPCGHAAWNATAQQNGDVIWMSQQKLGSEAPVTTSVEKLPDSGIEVSLSLTTAVASTVTASDNGEYTQLRVPGCGSTAEHIGFPEMPFKGFFLEIPSGVVPMIEMGKTATSALGKGFTIYPHQAPQPDNGDQGEVSFDMNETAYSLDAFYPSSPIVIGDPGFIRGRCVVFVQVFPLQYNPVTTEVRAFDSISFRLTFAGNQDGDGAARKARLATPESEDLAQRLILNYEPIEEQDANVQTKTLGANGADYLVIVADSFYEEVLPLAEWKRKKGFSTRVVKMSEVGGSTNTAVMNYIQNAYDTWTPAPYYVLLVGDSADVPPHEYSGSYSCTSDQPYACVDGSDYYPDLSVARLPVHTEADCTNVVNKILKYDRDPDTGSWYNDILAAAYFQDSDDSGVADRWFMETAMTVYKYLVEQQGWDGHTATCTSYWPLNYSTWHFRSSSYPHRSEVNLSRWGTSPYPDPVPSWITALWTSASQATSDVTSAINSGVGLVQHRDHGGETGWGDPPYSNSTINSLANGVKTPVVLSINCLTGSFQYSGGDCFCEAFLKKNPGGCVGIVGATRTSYSGYNDLLVHGIFTCLWPSYDPTHTNATYPHSTRIAEALNYGKYYMLIYEGTDSVTASEFHMFHWFGDPEMPLRTSTPTSLTVTYPSTMVFGQPVNIPVHVAHGGTPVANALVCISHATVDDHWTGLTNASGDVTFSGIVLSQQDDYSIVVTERNSIPHEGIICASLSSEGFIEIEREMYSASDSIVVTVGDLDLIGAGTQEVTIETSSGDSETMVLLEIGVSAGMFSDAIPTSGDAVTTGDGTLQVTHGDTITATYHDLDTGSGSPAFKTDTATADCQPPVISNVHATNVQDVTATIVFETDELSSGILRYGENPGGPYTIELIDTEWDTVHSFDLTGLSAITTYYFEIESADQVGNTVVDDNGGASYAFATDFGPMGEFEFGTIASPQYKDCPFQVTITARDIYGNIKTSFNDSVSLSGPTGTVEVLTFVKWADTAQEYPRTLQAISTYFTDYHETSTVTTDPATLAAELVGKDVFLIPEQESVTSGTLDSLGTSWASVLTDFVNAGGSVIACSWALDEHLILNNSGLLQLTKVGDSDPADVRTTTSHPLTEGVTSPFEARYVGRYTTSDGTVVLETVSGDPVVIYRNVGAGHAIMVASDFYTVGTDMDRIISNAVKWSDHAAIPIEPTTTGSFTNGVWTGPITVLQDTTDMFIHADDGADHYGKSNNFVVEPGIPLTVTLPDCATEGDGTLTNAGRIDVALAPSADLVVTLSCDDTSEITVPATVTIPAGMDYVLFDVEVQDDSGYDGTRMPLVTAEAPLPHITGESSIAVYDNEVNTLTVSIPSSAAEGDGVLTDAGTVTMTQPADGDVTINLSASDTTELAVPAMVVIHDGQTSTQFDITIIDDNEIDGTVALSIEASVTNWVPGSDDISVADNENRDLVVTLPESAWEADGLQTNAGTVRIDGTLTYDLIVSLESSDLTELAVESTATIVAGLTTASFDIDVKDDSAKDGHQSPVVTATASGFTDGTDSILVRDNDPDHFTISSISSPQTAAVPFSIAVGAENIDDEIISVFTGSCSLTAIGDTGSLPVTPATIGPFSNGQWTGVVSVNAVDNNVCITALDSLGNSGTSNVFDTIPGSLDHFEWNVIASPQYQHGPFAATLTAADANGFTVTSFSGPVDVGGWVGVGTGSSVVISELNPDSDDSVEFTNVSGQAIDISGWLITIYDVESWPSPLATVTVPSSTTLAAGGVFILEEHGTAPGTFPHFYFGYNINWTDTSTQVGILLRDNTGTIIDFATTGSSSSITSPVSIPSEHWSGSGISTSSTGTYQRKGNTDNNINTDWEAATSTIGSKNLNLTVPFPGGAETVAISLSSVSLTTGVWTGQITVLEEVPQMYLRADDGSGHLGDSNAFDVEYGIPIAVTLPENATEGDGTLTAAGQVQIPFPASENLEVQLSCGDTSEITVPATVTIVSGTASATFDIQVQDDAVFDGTQTAVVTASLPLPYIQGESSILVYDNDVNTITVSVPSAATEGDGTLTEAGTVTLSEPVTGDVIISLSSTDTSEATVPPAVTVLDGEASASFDITIIDDNQIDGPISLSITAAHTNWTLGSDNIEVLDNEDTVLTVDLITSAWESDGYIFSAGTVSIEGTLTYDLTINLESDDETELVVEPMVTILAGNTSAPFSINIEDDSDRDGQQQATVTATASGFFDGEAGVLVKDNDVHHYIIASLPSQRTVSVPFGIAVTAQNIDNQDITVLNTGTCGITASGDSGALPIDPTTTGVFSSGQWTGNVTISQLDTNVAITVTDGLGNSGTSNTFDVVPGPIDYFVWSTIPSPQYSVAPFDVTITAKDENGFTATGFNDPAFITAWSGMGTSSTVCITECGDDTPDFVEIQNVSGRSLDTSGWVVALNNAESSNINAVHDVLWELPTSIGAGQVLYGSDDTSSPNYIGTNIWWGSATSVGWAMIVDNLGNVVDFVAWGYSSSQIAAMNVTVNGYNITIGDAWSGEGITYIDTSSSFQRQGDSDNDDSSDWLVSPVTMGTQGTNITVPFTGGTQLLSSSPASVTFADGVWTGQVTVHDHFASTFLRVDDGVGHSSDSEPFDVEPGIPLTVTVPLSAYEGDGILSGEGRVDVGLAPSEDLTVELSSDDTSEVIVPVSVIIHSGETHALFDVEIQDDAVFDGTRTALITASAPVPHVAGSSPIIVYDDEVNTITISLPESATEGDGVLANAGTVTVSQPVTGDVAINLSSTDTTEATVPATVTILDGESSAQFDITIIDDGEIDGVVSLSVSAELDNWISGTDTFDVLDNEETYLSMDIPDSAWEGDGLLAGSGTVSITGTLTYDLEIALESDDETELTVQPVVTILAGQTSITFDLSVEDDPDHDGQQIVTVTASATGFDDGSDSMTIQDNDPNEYVVTAVASQQTAAIPFSVTVTARNVDGQTITVFNGSCAISAIGDSGPLPVSPENTGSFSNGEWSGSVAVNAVDTNVGVFFEDDLGILGASNLFDVVPGPVHHFTWEVVPSPQVAEAPFPVTITAMDQNNFLVAGFNGAVDITGWTNSSSSLESPDPESGDTVPLSTQLSISTSPSSPVFVDGVWTGEVTFNEHADDSYLMASDGSGHTGTSNTFDVHRAPPRTIYVDCDNVAGPWDGSIEHPFLTIQDGIDDAIEYDIVIVADGTYSGLRNMDLDLLGKILTIKSASGPADTIIDCAISGRAFLCENVADPGVLIEGFTITRGYTSSDGAGIYCYASVLKVKNCVIAGGNAGGVGGAIGARMSSVVTVENSVLAGNSAVVRGGAIFVGTGAATVSNCTITENYSGEGGGLASVWYSEISVTNSILWGNTAIIGQQAVIQGSTNPSSITVSYSNVEGGQAGINVSESCVLNWETGNTNADPLFIDSAGGNYHLCPASPCVNTGDPASDFSLEPLPNGDRINMGAYGNTAEATCTPGDVNGDTVIDKSDLMMAYDYLGAATFPPSADVNCDGEITYDDLDIVFENMPEDQKYLGGIPLNWIVRYIVPTDPTVPGLDPYVNQADMDNDNDGSPNIEEYLAGTDPTDPLSFFGITSIRMSTEKEGTVIEISWNAVDGKDYRLYSATGVGSGVTWTVVAGTYEVIGGTATQVVPYDGVETTLCFKVEVW